MEQNPFSEIKNFSATKGTSYILRNPEIYYCVHSYSRIFHSQSKPTFFSSLLTSNIFYQTFAYTSIPRLSQTYQSAVNLIPLNFNKIIKIIINFNKLNLVTITFSSASRPLFSILCPNIFHCHRVLRSPETVFPFSKEKSHAYKKQTHLYFVGPVSLFTFLGSE